MSELGPRAREILRSGRELNRPTVADRERIDDALRARLGAALITTGGSGKALLPPRPRWPFLTSMVVAAGLIGGGVFLAARHPATSPPAVHAVAPAIVSTSSASLPSPPTPIVEAPALEAPKPPALAASDHSTASARPAEDRLAQEVALLARATSSLHSGRAADALRVLDEYQRRFPKGMLTEERRAARAQALCALGRQSEAQSELARLTPHSLAAARAEQVCETYTAPR